MTCRFFELVSRLQISEQTNKKHLNPINRVEDRFLASGTPMIRISFQSSIQKRTWIVVEIHSSQSRVNWLNHDTGKFNDSHPLEIIQNPKLEHHRNQIVQTTHFYFLIIQMILQVRPKRARTWSRKDDRFLYTFVVQRNEMESLSV